MCMRTNSMCIICTCVSYIYIYVCTNTEIRIRNSPEESKKKNTLEPKLTTCQFLANEGAQMNQSALNWPKDDAPAPAAPLRAGYSNLPLQADGS